MTEYVLVDVYNKYVNSHKEVKKNDNGGREDDEIISFINFKSKNIFYKIIC